MNDVDVYLSWKNDWNKFIRDVLQARLDKEQQEIVTSVQFNKMTAVASGTARGKDFVAACCALSFLYLTPTFDGEVMTGNTKVAMTAPTGRQVTNIMTPEIRRLFRAAKVLPGRLVSDDIRTPYEEWFLTGFKAGDDATEAWSGFHATNTMFVVTEASGISEITFNAIEGNLQGNSRMLIVFNPNITSGYAARAMKQSRFKSFRLSSLNAENVVQKKIIIPGQVDYDWVADKVSYWTTKIEQTEAIEGNGDFFWEGSWRRPNDLFRVKVLGMFPRVSSDTLIPYEWIEMANSRWREWEENKFKYEDTAVFGVDVAGMGRDSSVIFPRYGRYVARPKIFQFSDEDAHMRIAGEIVQSLSSEDGSFAFIDTIGEGAGVYSRTKELEDEGVIRKGSTVSCKFSESAKNLRDATGVYEFANMRAWLYWQIRDFLDPSKNTNACLPPIDELTEELTEITWKFQSDGRIILESKDEIKKRLKRSPDLSDALANSFYPKPVAEEEVDYTGIFY